MQPSLRLQAVQSPIIPVVAELIRQNPGTISLGQGVVYYGPPPQAMEQVAVFAADPENHKYKAVHGIPELLAAMEAKLSAENDIRLTPESRLVVTAGSNMAFMNAVLAIADPGDELMLLSPFYFNHEMAITMANCRPVIVPTDGDYQPRIDAIEAAITPRTRAIVTISPNNPTGAVYSRESLTQINRLCAERRLYHISDEAYECFTYDGATHFSPGSLPGAEDHTISLFSLSKVYGFASWRIGYMVIPRRLFDPVRKIQDTILICPAVISQYAALGAMKAGPTYCREKMRKIAEVRAMVLEQLCELGRRLTMPRADGAFYFLVEVDTKLGSMQVVEHLIRRHGVAVIPGDTFGLNKGCHLRIAYGALQTHTAREGIGRFVSGIRALPA